MANLTGFRSDRAGLYATKDPASNIQYGLDFTDYLAAGDSITSTTDVNITGGNLVNVRLSGGSVQNVYTVKITIVTQQGDTDARSFRVIVQEKIL